MARQTVGSRTITRYPFAFMVNSRSALRPVCRCTSSLRKAQPPSALRISSDKSSSRHEGSNGLGGRCSFFSLFNGRDHVTSDSQSLCLLCVEPQGRWCVFRRRRPSRTPPCPTQGHGGLRTKQPRVQSKRLP